MEYEKLLSRYSYAELRIDTYNQSSIKINNQEVKCICGSGFGLSVRVLENGSWGFASGDRLEDLSKLLEDAKRLALLSKGKIKLKHENVSTARAKVKYSPSDLDEQVNSLLSLSKEMADKKIISRSVSFSESFTKKEFYNSLGSAAFEDQIHSYLSASAVAKEGTNIQRFSERSSSREGFHKLNLSLSENVKKKAIAMLGASSSFKGRFSVVLDPEMTGVFSHEALGHAAEADSVIDRESILAGKIGQKIGNENVTIIDDPTANDFGHYVFDDEGVRARPCVLIEKGILSNYMNSKETAQALDMELNGHARADGYSQVPVVRMSNTYFQKGSDSHSDVFDIRHGVYLKGMKGGSVDIFSGGFMFKAQEAYEIKNGEAGKLMKDVTITGNILQALNQIESVGKDFGTSPGICGKSGQEAAVSDGGPHIRIRNVAIG
ncbi:MAG: TldD/PmbA family protein [Candidatus Bilamarchaeum sp.]